VVWWAANSLFVPKATGYLTSAWRRLVSADDQRRACGWCGPAYLPIPAHVTAVTLARLSRRAWAASPRDRCGYFWLLPRCGDSACGSGGSGFDCWGRTVRREVIGVRAVPGCARPPARVCCKGALPRAPAGAAAAPGPNAERLVNELLYRLAALQVCEHQPGDFALVAMLGLLGLRIFEAQAQTSPTLATSTATRCCVYAAKAQRSSWSRCHQPSGRPSTGRPTTVSAGRFSKLASHSLDSKPFVAIANIQCPRRDQPNAIDEVAQEHRIVPVEQE